MATENIPREVYMIYHKAGFYGEIKLKYHTINLTTENLTEVIEVLSINADGTINTVKANRHMLLTTLESISYPTQKEAQKQAVINFVSSIDLFRDAEYYEYAKEFSKKYYPELVI